MTDRPVDQRWTPVGRWELLGLGAVVTVLVGLCLVLALDGAPLAHDESVYATRGRHYATGANEAGHGYWSDYRAVGLPRLFAMLWWLGGSDLSLRVVVIAAAVATMITTWLWARYLIGPRTALLSAVLLAVTPGFFVFAFLLVPDMPSTAFGLLAITTFAFASRTDRVTRLAYVAVPLAVLATFIRYGAPIFIGVGMTVVAASNWRAVRRSLVRTGVVAITMLAAIAAILFVPAVTDSTRAPALAFRARQGDGGLAAFASYVDLVELLPRLFGLIVGGIVAVGIVLAVRATRAGRLDRRAVTVSAAAVAAFVVTLNAGLGHLEVRYVAPVLPLLVPLAAAGWIRSWPDQGRARTVAAVAAAVVVIAAGATTFDAAAETVADRHRNFGRLQTAAQQLGEVASRPCLVVTGNQPQVVWYSGCDAMAFPQWLTNEEATTRDDMQRDLVSWLGRRAPDLASVTTIYALSMEEYKPRATRRPPLIEIGEQRVVEVGQPGDGRRQYIWVEDLGMWRDLQVGYTSGARFTLSSP